MTTLKLQFHLVARLLKLTGTRVVTVERSIYVPVGQAYVYSSKVDAWWGDTYLTRIALVAPDTHKNIKF